MNRIALLLLLLTLTPTARAERAHMDHSPKHGGQFFMAPDRFHHLEGALHGGRQFRFYLYDDHTRPVSAAPFVSRVRVEAVRINADGREIGGVIPMTVRLSKDGSYLAANLPKGMAPPVQVNAHVRFPKLEEDSLFNFSFVARE